MLEQVTREIQVVRLRALAKERNARYYIAHREECLVANARYRAAEIETEAGRARRRVYSARYQASHLANRREYVTQYRVAHLEQVRERERLQRERGKRVGTRAVRAVSPERKREGAF